METKIYNQTGKESGVITLPESVFGLPWNGDLVHQVVVSQQSNARTPVAHTKDRSEVSGGGKKPWRQKGTGRARHGSSRSPIWIGGGVTHGPRNEKNYVKKVNKKMRAKALYTVLSEKLRDGEVLFVDNLGTGEIKTKKAKEILVSLSGVAGFDGLAAKKRNAAYITLAQKDDNMEKSFKNFGNVNLNTVENMNLLDVLNYKYLVITDPEKSIEVIEKRGKKTAKTADSK
jgi:large subunit ribosomal protein L4